MVAGFVVSEERGRVATNPFQFLQQVRSETEKVVWPTRRETLITTVMVFIMCTVAAIFFFLVDRILGWGVGLVLG
ncbi:MAG: preprotein translocase subunit SecE [Pseudomonadota bacterium]